MQYSKRGAFLSIDETPELSAAQNFDRLGEREQNKEQQGDLFI